MSIKEYGHFNAELGSYTITELVPAGNYEYIYTNDDLLLKVDQYGVQTAQVDAPVGVALVKREKREIGSPIKVYFEVNGKVHNNFDVFTADSLKITFAPEKATYRLRFEDVEVTTELLITAVGKRFIMKTTFENKCEKDVSLRLLSCCFPYVNDLQMAPWDKPEWYTKSQRIEREYSTFTSTRYSVAGKKEERRYFSCVSDQKVISAELSAERLISATKNFTSLPEAFEKKTENVLYAFEQCYAALSEIDLKAGGKYALTEVFAATDDAQNQEKTWEDSAVYFEEKAIEAEMKALSEKFEKNFSVRKITTPDKTFDRFINGFLPLELSWVSALDRGWPTGMRGVRDASQDFQGYLAYDKARCAAVLENIFARQRSDGWYPRQVPFGSGEKFDMRHFVDSACFFTEFVYDYLAFTDDYSVLEKEYAYHDSEKKESGLTHLIKGVEYLMLPENLGEHGLVKMQGGDWLDCLSSAGIKGRGETVMVSCQLIMCLGYLNKVLAKLGKADEKYSRFATELSKRINEVSYNEEGFYNGVFTDNGEWIFSVKDPDGEKRVYAPTNAYAIISGVAAGREAKVLENVQTLRTANGYQLFSQPFGVKEIAGIGKMGTGDFQPYFAENASVYNHGAQCFMLRALATVGDTERFCEVLQFALPLYAQCHAPEAICAAPYAITNCYHLVPSFYGRTGFSFLTGSVSVIARAIYAWMFGVQFDLDEIYVTPCLPKRYENASVELSYSKTRMQISYVGYGSKVKSATLNGNKLPVTENGAVIAKSLLDGKDTVQIVIELE